VSAYLAALDEGVSVAVLSGPPSDLAVMRHHYNHPCWRWLNADAREYIGVSDLHALTAPRGLLIQSGKLETSYSWRNEHWAGAKQSARRVRAAYAGDSAAFLYYLHYDKHHYHMGDFNPSMRIEAGVRVPVLLEPESPWSLSWQTDGATTTDGSTIFDVIEALSPP